MTDHENPVVREAKARGDFAYFASQLRRGLGRWNQADIDTALPVIDHLAREETS